MAKSTTKQVNLDMGLMMEICESVPRGVLIADSDGKILHMNKILSNIFKVNQSEEIGNSLRTSKIFGAKSESRLILLVDEKTAFKYIDEVKCHDEVCHYEIRGIPFNGGFIIEAEDVTEQLNRVEQHELRQLKYERQIAIAQRLQKDLFPPKFLKKRIDVHTHLMTADDLAGDFFSITELGPNSIGVVIGDVVGKGIAASLMATSVHTLFMQEAKLLRPPSELLSIINSMIHGRFSRDFWYATAFYARILVRNLVVTYARAGHELPLLYRAATGEIEELAGDGLPLGMFSNPFYETKQIQLSDGDRLVFFTDGLTDAMSPNGDRFGKARLINILKEKAEKSGGEILNAIKSELGEFMLDMPPTDDIALAVFAVVPDMWTTWEIPPKSFDILLDTVLEELLEVGVDDDDAFAIRLAIDECVMNAQRHGNRCKLDIPIQVSYLIENTKATFKVKDTGCGFDYENLDDPTLEDNIFNPGGRGVFITRKFMDEVSFNEVGNEITIVKHFNLK